MRKLLAICVLVCYMLCAFGVGVSFHHCKGELKYVKLHHQDKKTCCKSKKKMPKGCCKTVKVEFKKSDDKGQSFLDFKPKAGTKDIVLNTPTSCYPAGGVPQQTDDRGAYQLRPPPLRTGEPLYVLYSVYRI